MWCFCCSDLLFISMYQGGITFCISCIMYVSMYIELVLKTNTGTINGLYLYIDLCNVALIVLLF